MVERIQWTGAIESGDHGPGAQVLHRKTKGVKLDGTPIINNKTTNGDQVVDNKWRTKDVTESNGAL